MSLYTDLRDAGCPIDHHASDLYTPVTETSTRILRHWLDEKQGRLASVGHFTDQDGVPMFDVFGAYDPFWRSVRV